MTTVVDPSGTPSPVYNRSGVTIASIAGSGSGDGSPTPIGTPTLIVAVTGHTIVLVSTSATEYDVMLPSDCEIGDVVEVYMVDENSSGVAVYTSSGETMNFSGNPVFATSNYGVRVRKVSSTSWRSLRSA